MTTDQTNSDSIIPFERRSFCVDGVATILACARSTVFEEIKRGTLQAFKVGRARRVSGAQIIAYQNRMSMPTRKTVRS